MRTCADRKHSRAQVSLEFLVLLTAILAFLSIWLSLILSVRTGVTTSLDHLQLEAMASDLREAADAVCLMGPGSSKEAELAGGVRIDFSTDSFTLYSGKERIKKELRCPGTESSVSIPKKRTALIRNADGRISLGLD